MKHSSHRDHGCGGEGGLGGAAGGFDGEAEGDSVRDGVVDNGGEVAGGEADGVAGLAAVYEPELPGVVGGELREISQYDDCRVRAGRQDDRGLTSSVDGAVDGAGVGFR